MRAASTRRLIWLARRLPSLLLSATLFAWLPRAALAQEKELKLRLSEQLSRDAEQRPRRAARAPRVRDRSGTLRLRLSRQLTEPPPSRSSRRALRVPRRLRLWRVPRHR